MHGAVEWSWYCRRRRRSPVFVRVTVRPLRRPTPIYGLATAETGARLHRFVTVVSH